MHCGGHDQPDPAGGQLAEDKLLPPGLVPEIASLDPTLETTEEAEMAEMAEEAVAP